jgi:hypothetical protein
MPSFGQIRIEPTVELASLGGAAATMRPSVRPSRIDQYARRADIGKMVMGLGPVACTLWRRLRLHREALLVRVEVSLKGFSSRTRGLSCADVMVASWGLWWSVR